MIIIEDPSWEGAFEVVWGGWRWFRGGKRKMMRIIVIKLQD